MEHGLKWPGRALGIDFSGAEDAGRAIWVASGVIEAQRLRIEWCLPGEALPGSGRQRTRCLEALRAFIAGQGAAAIGCDFPFGLPAALMGHDRWEDFVRCFAGRFATPEAFRAYCIEAAGGRELKRLTDREARTPFAAYNLRLYRQTYFGVRDLLAPLVREGAASVPPMQAPCAGVPWLLEICPASTLKQAGLYRPYKGRGEALRTARAEILDALACLIPFSLESRLRLVLLNNSGGDALDAVIAAAATFRTLQAPDRLHPRDHAAYATEGYVYV